MTRRCGILGSKVYDGLQVHLMDHGHADLLQTVFTMLDGMVDPFILPPSLQKTNEVLENYNEMKLKEMVDTTMLTSARESELNKKENRTLWDPTFNSAYRRMKEL